MGEIGAGEGKEMGKGRGGWDACSGDLLTFVQDLLLVFSNELLFDTQHQRLSASEKPTMEEWRAEGEDGGGGEKKAGCDADHVNLCR